MHPVFWCFTDPQSWNMRAHSSCCNVSNRLISSPLGEPCSPTGLDLIRCQIRGLYWIHCQVSFSYKILEKDASRRKKKSKFPRQEYVKCVVGTLKKLVQLEWKEGGSSTFAFGEVIGGNIGWDLVSECSGNHYFWGSEWRDKTSWL